MLSTMRKYFNRFTNGGGGGIVAGLGIWLTQGGLDRPIPTPIWYWVGVGLMAIGAGAVIYGWRYGDRLVEESYQFALSLDKLNYGTKKEGIDFELILSNSLINKPLMYEVALSKLYIEINGNKQTQLDKAIKGAVIQAGKSSIFLLGIFKAPSKYPYKGLLHYEIAYGHPRKLLFHQITELNLYISGPTYKQLTWTFKKQEDKPFKKSDFYKEY